MCGSIGGMSKETEAEQTSTYDVVVIGGGPAGENVAQYAIKGTDLTAVLVEGELLGGEAGVVDRA